MIQITYDIKYDGKSYGGSNLEKALYDASEASLKDEINNKLKNVKELENDAVTIHIDLISGQINIGDISNEEAKQKIIELLS